MRHTTTNRSTTLSGALCPLLLVATAVAAPTHHQDAGETGDLVPRVLPDRDEPVIVTPGHDLDRIVLKVRDDAGTAAEGQRLVGPPADRAVSELARLVDRIGASVSPVFDVPRDELDAMRRAGEAATGEALADLSQYYFLDLEGADPIAAVHELRAQLAVEEAYFATLPPPPPGDVFPPTPSFEDCATVTPCQGYLDAAPGGIDSRWAQGQPSGRGFGRRLADVEYAWNVNGLFGSTTGHEDLASINSRPARTPIGDTTNWRNPVPGDTNHGTAVLGVLAADRDSWGVTGIADGARVRVRAAYTTSGLNIAGAILASARAMGRGDVILVEMQNFGPNYTGSGQRGMVPVEYYGAEYSAIRQATALCIQVVEAAGNGEQDLDSTSPPFGDSTYPNRFDPRVRHSGATLVGAGTASTPHLRMWFSNHGERVDAYAWGEQVVTLGYGDLWSGGAASPDVDQYYTRTFAGTSSASSIVAGAAVVLNGAHVDTHAEHWRPAAQWRFLRTSGTATSTQYDEDIGRQPDLLDQMAVLAMGPQPAFVFTDETPTQHALDSFVAIGDVDGDGEGDFAVGSKDFGAGKVTAYSGLTGEPLWTWSGSQVGEKVGRSLAGGGDVNADGVPDVIVGAPTNGAGGTDAGRVVVLSGDDASVLHTFTGTTGANLGHAVASPGDLDGDGRDDVVAGQFGWSSGRGRVVAWSGATGAVLYTWDGAQTGSHFGQAVGAAGDFDGDGVPDVIVGAPFAGSLQNGEARVYSGDDGSLLFSVPSWSNYAWLGFSVAGIGDVDADGYDDVLVGAPNDGSGAGSARVYSGRTRAELFQNTLFGNSAANFGASVAGVGDHDGDGVPDFAIGAPIDGLGWLTAEGAVHVYSGATGAWIRRYVGQAPGNYLGTSVAGAGDVDGDGRDDLLLGARWFAPAGGASGRGYVFLAPNPRSCRPKNRSAQ